MFRASALTVDSALSVAVPSASAIAVAACTVTGTTLDDGNAKMIRKTTLAAFSASAADAFQTGAGFSVAVADSVGVDVVITPASATEATSVLRLTDLIGSTTRQIAVETLAAHVAAWADVAEGYLQMQE